MYSTGVSSRSSWWTECWLKIPMRSLRLSVIIPSVGASSSVRSLNSVLLPVPFAPTRQMRESRLMPKLSFSSSVGLSGYLGGSMRYSECGTQPAGYSGSLKGVGAQ
jgi:hypothetical protein